MGAGASTAVSEVRRHRNRALLRHFNTKGSDVLLCEEVRTCFQQWDPTNSGVVQKTQAMSILVSFDRELDAASFEALVDHIGVDQAGENCSYKGFIELLSPGYASPQNDKSAPCNGGISEQPETLHEKLISSLKENRMLHEKVFELNESSEQQAKSYSARVAQLEQALSAAGLEIPALPSEKLSSNTRTEDQESLKLDSGNQVVTNQLVRDIWTSSKMGDLPTLQRLVSTAKQKGDPAFFTKLDEWGNSPLYYACHRGHVELVFFLVGEYAQESAPSLAEDEKLRCQTNALNEATRRALTGAAGKPALVPEEDNFNAEGIAQLFGKEDDY